MKKTLLLALFFVVTVSYSFAKDYKITSPDNKVTVSVSVGPTIKWSATQEGKEIFSSSKIAMILANGKVLGENEKIRKVVTGKLHDIIKPVVANKKAEILDECNVLTIVFNSGFSVQFRA